MLCLYPFDRDGRLFGCGQCLNCRINKQRVWSSRIQLESMFHMDSTFVTLTYNDKNVPRCPNTGVQILSKRDLRNFIKLLRKYYKHQNSKFRFFACGEYGSKTQRPHYHLILFGVGLQAEPLIQKAWQEKGFHQVGELSPERASYVAQYTTKKLTAQDAPGLQGRPPEFATMSTNRGIGFPAIGWLADTMGRTDNLKLLKQFQDVWTAVRIGGKIWPLGMYMRRQLRNALGLSQDAIERAIQFDAIDKDTGEILVYADPLPEDYAPWKDFLDIHGPWRAKHGTKKEILELPSKREEASIRFRKSQKRKPTESV